LPEQFDPDIICELAGFKGDEAQAMTPKERKAASAAYKERKSAAGVYASRCAPTGEVWVGQTGDLEKVWNRISFSLRSGAGPRRDLQTAWNAFGAPGFAFEVLERLEDEDLPYVRDALLKDRLAHWRGKLGAAAI
jgi:hypothetical protein